MARLSKHIVHVYSFRQPSQYFWSNSMITLAWIKDSPHKHTTYVVNWVSEIQSLGTILKMVQEESFSNEIKILNSEKPPNKHSRFNSF